MAPCSPPNQHKNAGGHAGEEPGLRDQGLPIIRHPSLSRMQEAHFKATADPFEMEVNTQRHAIEAIGCLRRRIAHKTSSGAVRSSTLSGTFPQKR